jgi:thymidylate kinase
MYRRLIIPALEAGKTIVQDRGISTSIVYQPIQPNGLPLEAILNLPGNRLSLKHMPQHLILASIPVDQVATRIVTRKDDAKGVFADLELMRRVDTRFREPWFRELFESHGTHIHTLDTSGTLVDTQAKAVALIRALLHDHPLTTSL